MASRGTRHLSRTNEGKIHMGKCGRLTQMCNFSFRNIGLQTTGSRMGECFKKYE